ncbi:unnamed protein product [Discula destructiva]
MRVPLLAFALTGLAQSAAGLINITQSNDVNLANGTGTLGWGASNLPFGYSAGVGFNFDEGARSLGGGFNGAVPGRENGAFGGGYTVNSSAITLGLGGVLGNTSFGVAVMQDMETGRLSIMVNGKEVAL